MAYFFFSGTETKYRATNANQTQRALPNSAASANLDSSHFRLVRDGYQFLWVLPVPRPCGRKYFCECRHFRWVIDAYCFWLLPSQAQYTVFFVSLRAGISKIAERFEGRRHRLQIYWLLQANWNAAIFCKGLVKKERVFLFFLLFVFFFRRESRHVRS